MIEPLIRLLFDQPQVLIQLRHLVPECGGLGFGVGEMRLQFWEIVIRILSMQYACQCVI